jgi:membrane protein required for colicin V production
MQLAALDWIWLVILLVSLVIGAWRGLVYEVLSVLGWIAAFIMAQLFAATVGGMLPMAGSSEGLRYAAGFVVTFIASAFAAGLLSFLAKKLIEATGLRPADRVLGALFGLARGLIILLAIATAVLMTPLREAAWWRESVGGGVLGAALKGLKPVLPESVGQFIQS